MHPIRPARASDLPRIAEIYIFNYRLNFYPIFRNDEYYFTELQGPSLTEEFLKDSEFLRSTYVYDDGAVKGFIQTDHGEIRKLFVEPVLQGNGIGTLLLEFAVHEKDARSLWALEKNTRAIVFYQRHGFRLTDEKKLEDDTSEYLVKMVR